MVTLRLISLLAIALGISAKSWDPRTIDSPCDRYRDRYRKQPNIVYIMADDMGWNDVGFHNSKVKTPNLDALRAKGIELTQSYVQRICSPSRSSFMTGKYPSKNGLQTLVVLASSQNCLPIEHKTIFEHMRDEGYVTKYVGKWHLGTCNSTCLPEYRGVDEFRGVLSGSVDYFTWTRQDILTRYVNGEPSSEDVGMHLTIKDGKDVEEMILAHKGSRDPMFMWITPTAPHDPLQPTEEMFDVHDFLNATNPETRGRREYLGLVSAFDDLVGRTMDALKEARMDRNTIIVFSSDNGGAAISQFFEADEMFANNYPLRNGKFASTEGGVRTPAVYYDPRLHPRTRGTTRDFMVHITDWLPTFVQLGSTGPKKSDFTISGIDGVSQVANLGSRYNQPTERKYNLREEMLVTLTTNDLTEGLECSNEDATYRWRDYKLIYGKRYTYTDPSLIPTEWPKPQESPELADITGDSCLREENGETVTRCLFNVVADPSETRNLYDDEPEIVAKILEMINNAKQEAVTPVFTASLGTSNVTAELFEDVFLVPRTDYCSSAVNFPLTPIDPSCY